MTILVTGGTGLIGSQVLEQLVAAGREVVAATRRPPERADAVAGVDYVRADITDGARMAALAARGVEAVIHLAALRDDECEADPEAAVAVNVEGTLNLLRAARDAGVRRFVFGSSIAVYGGSDAPLTEESLPGAPVRLYGQTKALGEALVARFRALHGLQAVSLRYGSIYGPGGIGVRIGRSAERNALMRTLHGEPVTLDRASGQERFQFTYSKDAAGATVRAIDHPGPEYDVYNVSGPEADYVSLAAFYQRMCEIAPRAGAARFTGNGRPSMPVSIARMVEDLGYTPRYPIADAFRDELARGP